MRTSLLTHSLARLRKETPEDFLALVTEWLYPHREQFWSNGLQALLPLVKNPAFENLPPIFTLIEPVIEAAPTTLQKDIQNIILALYKDAPTETSYFLKNLIKKSENPKTRILLRRILPALPPPLQENLQKELKAR